MKIIRYEDRSGSIGYAAEAAGRYVALRGGVYGAPQLSETAVAPVRILAPIEPRQIIGIGLNYRRHAAEAGVSAPEQPVVFYKGVNAAVGPDHPICLPSRLPSDEVDYECELAVMIGRTCRNASRANALEHVLGYTCANDVSARDWQLRRGGSQWCRGKSFDTFCPLGPCLVTTDEIPNPSALRIGTLLNGERVQDWTTSDMIFDVPTLIEFLSADCTLPAGTVILTGTPHGVGMGSKPPRWLKAGDVVSIEIERIGTLTNPVVADCASGKLG